VRVHDQVGVYATLGLLVNNRWTLRQAQAGAGKQLTQILDQAQICSLPLAESCGSRCGVPINQCAPVPRITALAVRHSRRKSVWKLQLSM
jgi:hypothetical protein